MADEAVVQWLDNLDFGTTSHNVWNSNLSKDRNFSMSSGHGNQPIDSAGNEHNRCLLGGKKGGQGKAATTIILQTLWST